MRFVKRFATVLCLVFVTSQLSAQGYSRVRSGSLACQQRTDWAKLSQILARGDKRAVQRFLGSLTPDRDCRRFFGHRPVFVQIHSVDTVCVRPLGELECLWTGVDNLE